MMRFNVLPAVLLSCVSLAAVAAEQSLAQLVAEEFPFTFTYDGRAHKGVSGLASDGKGGSRLDENVTVRVESAVDAEFGVREYTVWFENVGRGPSKVLKDVCCLDAEFAGADPVLTGIYGDGRGEDHSRYERYSKPLKDGKVAFVEQYGRATQDCFPYFNLIHGDGGTLIALGWSGCWSAEFSAAKGSAHVSAKTCRDFCAVLMPGERVRTGQVVMLNYKGRDEDRAMNVWRRWYMKHVLPRNADGSPIAPFVTASFSLDTGLPNMDGSVSERAATWRRTFDKLLDEKIPIDYRWFDAGWYCDPGKGVDLADWHYVGTWELDWVKWPGRTFLESVEYGRRHGVKTLVWFEPERTSDVESLATNFGYRAEWAALTKKGRDRYLNDIGNPDCYRWTRDRIFKAFERMDPDLYREDFNLWPVSAAWQELDRRKEAACKLPRSGISENFGVQAHYRLWDEIIANRRAHGRCPYVDSCASGGGRNDIESMRRGFPLMRSDFDRMILSRRLSMTTSLCRWLPFHGSFVKETKAAIEPSTGSGPDKYVFRASMLPICNLVESFTQNGEFDYGLLRRNLAEWKSVAPLTVKDFHVLTKWLDENDSSGWTAWAWDDPEKGEAALLAFRQETCPEPKCEVRLKFLDAAATYEVEDADEGTRRTCPGAALRNGLCLELAKPRSSLLLRIRKRNR